MAHWGGGGFRAKKKKQTIIFNFVSLCIITYANLKRIQHQKYMLAEKIQLVSE